MTSDPRRRLVVMAHFDPDGLVAPHVRRQIEAWLVMGLRLVVVTTAELQGSERRWLEERVTLVERENVGYDFLSYREGLRAGGDLSHYDEVVICNDTFVGPLRPYPEIFAEMADREADFWGIARCNRRKPHIQSYFVVFRRELLASEAFHRFWDEMQVLPSRGAVIRRYEVGMSVKFRKAGFRFGSYFKETGSERRLGRLRVIWWVLRRNPARQERRSPATLWQEMHEPWNPSAAMADTALRHGRIPVVKIDTLRHDPYGLNPSKLLAALEEAYPIEFSGVRAYLNRTASRYPTRKGEELRQTPWWLRPFARVVEYRAR